MTHLHHNSFLPIFDPHGPGALAIDHLFVTVLIICAVIFAVVTGLVLYCIRNFRAPPGGAASEPVQTFGNRRLELIWTAIPLATVGVIYGLMLVAMRASNPAAAGPPEVIVRGHQWWWEAIYPQGGFETANEIHIPVGRYVRFRLETADVIHDFWVPELGRKIDMIPGHPVQIELRANQPGIYAGTCAEFCGAEHAWMRIRVVAQPEAQYKAWLEREAKPAASPVTAEAIAGRTLFERYTCVNCHAVEGIDRARVAPDLTHFASRRTLGAGVLANTPADLARWLENPQAVKPGCLMPNFNLKPGEVRDLCAYLETLK